MRYYTGLDVSMKNTFICVVNEDGKAVYEVVEKTDPKLIAIHLRKYKSEKIGIESGSLSFWLVQELIKLKMPAICIDSKKMGTLLALNINKTDKNDAKVIADAIRCNLYQEVSLKSKKSINQKILLTVRRTLVKQKTLLKNTIRGLLKSHGIRLGYLMPQKFIEQVTLALENLDQIVKLSIKSILDCFENTCKQLELLEKEIKIISQSNEQIKRLKSIPGIGSITALSYVSTIDNPKRFKKSRSVGAYIGMTPRQYSSGDTKYQGRISKQGCKELRTLLNESAVVLLTRTNTWSKLKHWGLKIMRKHGLKKASIAVGRKLAIIMHKMLIEETEFIYGEIA